MRSRLALLLAAAALPPAGCGGATKVIEPAGEAISKARQGASDAAAATRDLRNKRGVLCARVKADQVNDAAQGRPVEQVPGC
jgi:hypothetical protein